MVSGKKGCPVIDEVLYVHTLKPCRGIIVAITVRLQKSSKTDIEGWLERNTCLLEKVKAGKVGATRNKPMSNA